MLIFARYRPITCEQADKVSTRCIRDEFRFAWPFAVF